MNEGDDFEKYLEEKKAELRKLKDSDFVETSFYAHPKIVDKIDRAMDILAKRHEMDTVEVGAAAISSGLETLEKIIKNKGEEYTLNLILELSAANDRGDIKKIAELTDKMRIDAEGKEDNIRKNEYKDKEDKEKENENKDKCKDNISFEQFVRENESLLDESFDYSKGEDFELIIARNPEDPEDTMELYPHKTQVEQLKIMSVSLGVPIEELAYRMILYAVEGSENTPIEIKQEIRKSIERQDRKIRDNIHNELESTFGGISTWQIKNMLQDLHHLPMNKLDNMERSWRKEYKTDKLDNQYKDVEMYIKVKFLYMLKDYDET
jgi:hypothetical protein